MQPTDVDDRPRLRPLVLRILLAMCGILLVVGIGMGVDVYRGNRRVTAALDRIRARGEPTSVKEIEFEHVPPSDLQERMKPLDDLFERAPDPDTYDLDGLVANLEDPTSPPEWRSAADTVKRFAACWNSEHPVPSAASWTNDVLEASRDPRRLDALTPCDRLGLHAIGAVREPLVAAAMDVCAVPRETGETCARAWTTEHTGAPFEEIRGPALAAILLCETIPALLIDDESQLAAARIEAIFHVARSTRDIPWWMGYRFWTGCAMTGLTACREVTASNAHDFDWSGIERELADMDPRAYLRRAILGERAFGIEVFQAERNRSAKDAFAPLEPSIFFPIDRALNRSQDFALFLEAYEEGVVLSRNPEWDPNPGSQDWQRGKASFPDWARGSAQLLTDFENDRAGATWLEAEIRLARVAIVAFRDGAQAGVDAAARSVDPFDGKPLRARVEPGALVLWSVGPDHIDDGGSDEFPFPAPRRTFKMKKDDVWVVRVR